MTAKEVKSKEESITLDLLIPKLNAKFGVNTVTYGSAHQPDPPRIPSGIFAFDFMTGGGIPVWHSTCFWGGNSGGKSSMTGNVVACSQQFCWRCFNIGELCTCSQSPLKLKAVYQNIEGTLDPLWFSNIGVDNDDLVVVEADYGEQYSDIAESVLSSDECGLLVVDSLATLVPSTEMSGSAEDDYYAIQAKLIGRMVRRLKQRLIREKKRERPCTILFTNQMREKIGVHFGSNEKQPGGHQMMHEFSLLVRTSKIALAKTDKEKFDAKERDLNSVVRHSLTIHKNKVFIIAGSGEFVRAKERIDAYDLNPGQVDDSAIILNYAKRYGVVRKEGAGWKYFDKDAKKLSNIEQVLKTVPIERFRVCSEIIQRAKHEILHGKGLPADAPEEV